MEIKSKSILQDYMCWVKGQEIKNNFKVSGLNNTGLAEVATNRRV